jgi:hypothetical protein
LRFTVHRPPCGEVSLCWYRPSGGDVSGRVHVGVARPCFADDAHEDRLTLAVFGCDVSTNGASLRRVRGRDEFDSSQSLVVKPGDQLAPALKANCSVQPSFLCDLNAGLRKRSPRRAGHRPYVELFHSNCVESARQIRCRLLDPVASPVRFARFDSRDRKLGALSAVGATFCARQALLQPAQPDSLAGCKARSMQQFPSGQCRRHRHTAVDANHAAVPGRGNRVRDVREGDMPAPGTISSNAVRLHPMGHRPRRTEADPSDLGHPYPPVAPVELLDVACLDPDLPEAFMHAGLAPRRATMGAGEEVLHRLGEVAQRLLLHGLRAGCQPVVLGADLRQLSALLVITRGVASRLPPLLLLDSQIPHEPRVAAMLHQHDLLSWCGQQSEPGHTRKITTTTDIAGDRRRAQVRIGIPRWQKCCGFPPKEIR